jgi:hypothetical protein
LKASGDHSCLIRDICIANKEHLTSLHLDFDPWFGLELFFLSRFGPQNPGRCDPRSANRLVSGILSKIGNLDALRNLSITTASLLDESRNYAEVLNICQLRSLHLHQCGISANFLTGLAAAVEKKHIYLSLVDFELVEIIYKQYELCLGRFLACFGGLKHLALVFTLQTASWVDGQFVIIDQAELASISATFWRGVQHHKETLRDLIICPRVPGSEESSKRRHLPFWELAAGTLSTLDLHRFACNSELANEVRDSMLIGVKP